MRTTFLMLMLLTLTSTLTAQTPVDRLAGELEFQSSGSIADWKYSTDFTRDPTAPGFQDSAWKSLKLNESLMIDSCWIRRTVIIPDKMLGETVSGGMRLILSVDDFGYMWINGESKGRFPWDGDFVLTSAAHPGETFTIVIKAINTGGPLRLIRANLRREQVSTLAQMSQDLALGLRVGQKLLSSDTYQTNAWTKQDPGIDRSRVDPERKKQLAQLLQNAAGEFDATMLRTGTPERITAALNALRTRLKPVADYARSFTLFFDANAHIDAAWLWRDKETVEVVKNTFSSVLNMMVQRPDFTYTQSSAAYYDWMEHLYPEMFKRIQDRVKEGRWEIVGGMWIEPDCNLPSGESWSRHLLYAKRYFRNTLGSDVKIGWNPDSFGYNGNMPMFYSNAGITAFITQKIGWNETNVFPHRVFWWESADGSRILSYFPFDYVNTIDDPFKLVDWVRQFEANTSFTKLLILFGVGDHGGGPSLEMIDRIERLRSVDIFPTIEYGTARQYLSWLTGQNIAGLPVWKDELYLEYHQGTFTTQAAMKQANRREEVLLTNAEKFSSFASLSNRQYASADLTEAWKKLLFSQFHDILPGSSIHEVYVDTKAIHADVQAIGEFELNSALDHIARGVNTSALRNGQPVVVFNSLSWPRTDVVRLKLPAGDRNPYALFDETGKEIPSQILTKSKYDRELLFLATDVPSLGYRTFELRAQAPRTWPSTLAITPWTIKNATFSLAIDSTSGWVTSIIDHRTGREILSGPGNRLQLLEDLPAQWDAWNIGLTGVEFPSKFRAVKVMETGPVCAVLRLQRDYLKPGKKKEFPTEDFPSSFFTQDIVLYNALDRIDFVTTADWWEEKTMLKVAFPLAVSDSVATYEIPYGTVQRSTQMRNSFEKAKVEVPASRWADLSSADYGVSLINTSKYGYDIKGNVMRLSLLRSPKWPDPMADRGMHTIAYALYPHAGRWDQGSTIHRGYELNAPLIPVYTTRHTGKQPASHAFCTFDPDRLVLTSIKKAEDSNAWIMQWYNTSDSSEEAVIHLPGTPKRAVRVNFLEEEVGPAVIEGALVKVATRPHSVETLKVAF